MCYILLKAFKSIIIIHVCIFSPVVREMKRVKREATQIFHVHDSFSTAGEHTDSRSCGKIPPPPPPTPHPTSFYACVSIYGYSDIDIIACEQLTKRCVSSS